MADSNDNTNNHVATKSILLLIAIVCTITFIRLIASMPDNANDDEIQIDKIGLIDTHIKKLNHQIDSLRNTTEERTHALTKKHPDYSKMANSQHTIDSLHQVNDSILHVAHLYALKNTTINTPYNDERLFTQHRDMPIIRKAGRQYRQNNQKIQEYTKHLERFRRLQASAFTHVNTSNMHQIRKLQQQIDSLLDYKNKLITEKMK